MVLDALLMLTDISSVAIFLETRIAPGGGPNNR